MQDLTHLADLIRQRNAVDTDIARLIGRPATTGHIGEFIAGIIFDIGLHDSAVTKASDGHFMSGPLKGQSVNIKIAGKNDGLLNLLGSDNPEAHAAFYLVLTGETVQPISSRGTHAPLVIEQVFLFDAQALLAALLTGSRPVKIGAGTSVRKHLWQQAMIYPTQVNQALILSEGQRAALKLFAPQTET